MTVLSPLEHGGQTTGRFRAARFRRRTRIDRGQSPGATSEHSGLTLSWTAGVPDRPAEVPMLASALNRAVDIVLGLAALVALAPLMASIALAIGLSSPGPVLFRQTRVGFAARPFTILKFRTLHLAACDGSGVRQITADDQRLTALGRLLRQYSLDELPQLVNVLRGDMALVGPRPHVPGMLAGTLPYEQLVPYYDLRHRVRPGLTGWAQVNGLRGATDEPAVAQARIEHDLAYIQNQTLWLNLAIIVRTAWQEAGGGTGR